MDLDSAENPGRFFAALSRDLKSLALSNIQYFQNGKQSHHAKFHVTFSLLYEYLDIGIEPSYRELSKHLSQYDFSPEVKGNGYRSLLRVVQKCCLHLLQLSRYISSVRDSILFRKKLYAKELESYVAALGQLRAVLYYALKLIHYCVEGELFADEEKLNSEVAEQLVLDVESLSQESFYGRCLGFQFSDSMQRPLQALAIAMASYSEGYLETSQMMQVATSVFNSGKYFLDPELRAQQMVKVTRTADIKFCKAFWGFSESTLMHQLPSFVCPSVEVNEVITLGPDAFELPLVDGTDTVVITPPCAHTGPGHVYTRLISAHLREGQLTLKKAGKAKTPPAVKPATPGLILHMHGGGFVAHSSKSHEVYLRDWAVTLAVPILSVDYSLAPEFPFPRALEECFYAYAWALENCHQLGSTGETILLVGDSAGANLAISTAMRAASFGIRAPDGIMAVYPSTMVRYTPSPARLLSLMDPILPVGLVTRCLAAYAGINEQHPLASPQMDDVHSHHSLTRLRMASYETSDNEWIIIAQDQEEADKLRSQDHAVDTPVYADNIGTKSVIDSMEDSFHGSLAAPAETDIRHSGIASQGDIGSSDLEDSEEVELFCRLQAEGSCVFPSDNVSAGLASEGVDSTGTNGQIDKGAQINTHKLPSAGPEKSETEQDGNLTDGSAKSNFGGIIQERARQVVEGAQNVLTSLSSYIPSSSQVAANNVIASFSSLLSTPTSSTQSGVATPHGQPRVFNDFDAQSDPVDEMSGPDKTDHGEERNVDSQSQELSLQQVKARDPGLPDPQDMDSSMDIVETESHELTTESGPVTSDPATDGQRYGHSTHHDSHRPHELEDMQTREDKKLLTQIMDSEMSTLGQTSVDGGGSREREEIPPPSGLHMDRNSNIPVEISPDSDIVLDSSSSSVPTSSSQMFDTAHSSPYSSSHPVLPASASVDTMDSVSLSSESSHQGYHSAGEKPASEGMATGQSVGPCHNSGMIEVTTVPLVQHRESTQVPDLPPAGHSGSAVESVSSWSSGPGAIRPAVREDRSVGLVAMDTSTPLKEESPATVQSNKQGTSGPLLESHEVCGTVDLRLLSPEIPVTMFYDEDFPNSPVSPSLFPNLPAESQQLLEDALQLMDSPAGQPVTGSTNVCNSQIDDVPRNRNSGQQPQANSCSVTDAPASQDQSEVGQGSHDLFSQQQQLTMQVMDRTMTNEDTVPECQSCVSSNIRQNKPAIPPQTLNLQTQVKPNPRHTSVLSPSSPSKVFADDPEPFESVDPELTFENAQLQMEFLTPSSVSEVSKPRSSTSPTTSRSDGFIRSGSVPALTSMLSPKATSPHVGAAAGPVLFPYGLKAGMSPSDFQKQTYTAHSPLHTLRKAPIVNNPYMSPLMAPDELLKGLTRVSIVGCHLDPLLDDSIMFARRLRDLNVPVKLQLVDDLPHGFLNFALLSLEAKQASDLCSCQILELLNNPGL